MVILIDPLMVIGDLFEGQGTKALLNAKAEVAEFVQQLSEGKAPGECEEALLQAKEILTAGAPDSHLWIKTSDVREQVRALMSVTAEQMGIALWIGHLMKLVATYSSLTPQAIQRKQTLCYLAD